MSWLTAMVFRPYTQLDLSTYHVVGRTDVIQESYAVPL